MLKCKKIILILAIIWCNIIVFGEEKINESMVANQTAIKTVEEKTEDINNRGIKEEKLEKKLEEIQSRSIDENKERLFGYRIFNNKSNNLGLPSETAVGKDYVLSAGDVLKIRVFGDTLPMELLTGDIELPISTAGNISLPVIGAFNARGKSITELEKEISLKGVAKFRDFRLDISLHKMRSLKVFVLGEVVNPGVQIMNPLSNVISAIYSAGGITDNSSLRTVKILRGDKQIVIDLYEYLVEGLPKSSEYMLLEGDTVFVPVIDRKVLVSGEVNRPAYYEIKNEKKLSEVVKLAGGYKNEYDINSIKITRIENNSEKKVIEPVKADDEIKSGDKIEVGKVTEQIRNSITLIGNIYKPGLYEIKNGDTYKTILERAGGYKPDTFLKKIDLIRKGNDTKLTKMSFGAEEDIKLVGEDTIYVYSAEEIGEVTYISIKGSVKAPGSYKVYKNTKVADSIFIAKGLNDSNVFLQRASIFRINKDGGTDIINVNLEKAMSGDSENNVELKPYDSVMIYSFDDVQTDKYITVYGEVNKPGRLAYYNHMTLEDVIFLTKNYKESADLEKIEIFRINKETREMETLKIDYKTQSKFIIQPDDSIFIRKYEKYPEKKVVKLVGQFKYPGEYVIYDNETINQLIKRAGGYKENAFPVGAKAIRKENVAQIFDNMNKRVSKEIEISITSGTGIKPEAINQERTEIGNLMYDAKKSEFRNDIQLKDGDQILVEATPTTVKILGEVYFPREVGYEEGVAGFEYYVEAAGGYTLKALKDEVFVIKADGKVKKNGMFSKVKIEAGDTIVIPFDPREKKEFDFLGDSMKVLQWLVTVLTVYTLVK